MSVLVVDVGTSGVRAAVVGGDATVEHVHHREVLPTTPAPGFVEFDAAAMAAASLDVAQAALAGGGPVDAVGIANQRSSTVVWDRATGEPVGPGVGWQDLRTVGMCLALREQGVRVAPNASATKLAFLLDMADPGRERDLCFGTVDTWVAWTLSGGALHVTDLSNAAVTGLVTTDGSGWDPRVLEVLRVPERVLPAIVDSSGAVGEAGALPGAPPIAGIAGDQQASLVGQGCTRPGLAKVTRGTGGPEIVRAVLEGVAHRGADLVESAEADGNVKISSLRVDGGMSANRTFVQALADAAARPVEVSPVLEATTLGAAFLAGLAIGTWKDEDDVAETWQPNKV